MTGTKQVFPAAPLAALAILSLPAHAQFGRGAGDWSTAGADAARSSWVRTDPKISPAGMQGPGFALVWKVKLGAGPTVPVLLTGYIGYRGFRSLGYTTGSAGTISALDTDLGRVEWQKTLPAAQSRSTSAGCSGGLSANVTRLVPTAFPAAPQGGRGGGRGTAAKSGVGDPAEGAVTIAQVAAAAARAGAPGRGPGRGPGMPRLPNFIYALSADGMLHSMYVSNGEEPEAPIRFLPANANAEGLIVVDNVAYAATAHDCGGVANGVWALDIESRQVASWKPATGDIAGTAGVAIAPDGKLYVTTTAGDLVALEPKTLKVKATYAAKQAFTSSPILFESKDQTLIAATTVDGRLHLLDAASLAAPLNVAQAAPAAGLGSWEDPAGTRWILAAAPASVMGWKVKDSALQPGWTSREIASPFPPMIVNGVIFALGGNPGVLYALDSATGKEFWNSGRTISGPARAFSGGGTQIYVAAADGTLYAFGFPMEH